ncbi:MAG TPA: scyllo-inosose 3-dehydrogenase [Brevefilum fermentans]|jgi:threonine dehydrogenase-like Zn-dependent dehydrogenase|uniref:Adh n=1 Tax=Candidatus Brevifilum fermentans TaxID=1986204 RepID=A0A1Y6K2P3_9CHLR|nr:scyllo-inosose 3-dehydrogenase [Brevefilum fermentans]MDI9567205.1 scyllo-inosose 3-dehydrogenase [Chloroflexota bacterium]OQB86595.1 MAG: putative zinc-type alcohol dehydrogenase-like protein YjmD [Chloroflexi bacterium ADurb.Bin120]SMX53836.1 Adh [Brevefilum fermentans]HOM66693.1 scyllo-inosose 3-dehydrogenase [Brevefilum fermentans]HPX95400.1 scyllo-inosose 3-dehydrogenase [Brevefilum fermentans]
MKEKMQGVTLIADWDPKPGFKLGPKDIEGRQTYLGSQVWRNPRIEIREYDIPVPGDDEVLIEVKACGICGSDVHMAQAEADGYIFYPGLTGFPSILGHELSGVVVEAGKNAYDKNTNKPYKGGEEVTTEEMLWCGSCKPCADGWPNHCERLDEIGFNVHGAFTKYLVVPARTLWSLEPLKERYPEDKLFLAGSLVEPTCVAYNAVIERGGGIRPGDRAVVLGGGPVGLAACAILKRAGASKVIISETQEDRGKMALKLGADYHINPLNEDFAETVLELTNGMGADLFMEATGLPEVVYPDIEKVIWEGRTLNSKVVVTARAEAKMPVTGEVLQVRRASIIGAQGHSGHGTFPRVIDCMADGMDMTLISTKQISLAEVPENIIQLQTDRSQCKVTYLANL